jgi:hypothetical protein
MHEHYWLFSLLWPFGSFGSLLIPLGWPCPRHVGGAIPAPEPASGRRRAARPRGPHTRPSSTRLTDESPPDSAHDVADTGFGLGDGLPFEFHKPTDWGWLEGKAVAVDYAANLDDED